jgi:hypothetical protein
MINLIFSDMISLFFLKCWNLYNLDFLIIFYLEHKGTPILEDYINDTLKDDRNRF